MKNRQALLVLEKQPRQAAATKLLSKRKELYEAQDKLVIKREYFSREKVRIQDRAQLIANEDRKLQHELQKISHLIANAESKKTDIEKEIKSEGAKLQSIRNELAALDADMKTQQAIKHGLATKSCSLQKCEVFLKKVTSYYPDQYSEIPEMLHRYKNLKDSIRMLEEQNGVIEVEKEGIKQDYNRIEKEKTNEILLLNIELASLQKELEVG